MNNIYSIVFKDNGKAYNFISDKEYEINNYVIVETEKGYQYGKVVKKEINNDQNIQMKPIIRKATEKDQEKHLDNLEAASRALKNTISIVEEMGIEMNIIDASYTFDKKQLLFNFIANERIDFRELVKKLAIIYKTRIELRQIGVRDKAKEVGGLGQCGRILCCNSFHNTGDSITMNMAKNQNLSLNPNKINGACGRLLCCLAYEDELYSENRKEIPNLGEIVNTEYGKGKVESIDILSKSYVVLINEERHTITTKK